MIRRLAIAFLALFALLTVFGLGILAAPAGATQLHSSSCPVWVTSPLTVSGNQATVTLSTEKGCTTKVGLAVYETPGAKFDPTTADQQKLVGAVGVDLAAGQTLWLPLPSCYFQVDVFRGDVIKHLSATNLYGQRLIASATGGSKPCQTATTTTAAPTTTTTVSLKKATLTAVKPQSTTTTTAAPELRAPDIIDR